MGVLDCNASGKINKKRGQAVFLSPLCEFPT
jgi:hypothetical protein